MGFHVEMSECRKFLDVQVKSEGKNILEGPIKSIKEFIGTYRRVSNESFWVPVTLSVCQDFVNLGEFLSGPQNR
jgi:hypothetical protein